MKFFRMLPYFTHVLPLEYDLSLTPYEILSKLFKWLDELTPVVNQHSEEILKIKEELEELSHKGFTNEQLREVLDEMLADGEFDFLIDLYSGSTIFNQLVGIEPYAQLIPEVLQSGGHFGNDTDMTAVTMAIAEVNGIPYVQMGFCGSGYTKSELITFNLLTGDVIAHKANTDKTHIGDASYNPKDGYFYYTGGTEKKNGFTWISVFDLGCNHIKDIPAYTNSRIGHICFLEDGTAYLINMPMGSGSSQELVVYDDITEITEFTSEEAASHIIYTLDYTLPSDHQRQGMFTDQRYLYVLRGRLGSDYDITNRYQVIDVFSINNKIPTYYQTITLDSEMEMETGDFYDGTYYINFNSMRSGLICKANIKAQDLKLNNNRAYSYLTHSRRVVKLGYTETNIYIDSTANNYLVTGDSDYPFHRLETALRLLPNKPQDGITIHITGDMRVNGIYTRTLYRCVKEKLTIKGESNAILPYQSVSHCMDVRFQDVTIYGDLNQCIQIYESVHSELSGVAFVGSSTANIISIEDSEVEISNSTITGTFTRALNVQTGSRVTGRLEYDGTNTRIGEYAFAVNTDKFRNDGAYFVVTDAGIYINAHVVATSDISIDDVVMSLPSTYKVRWTLDRLAFPSDPFVAAGDNRIYYDSTDKDFKTALAIDSGTSLVINGFVPVGTLSI